MIFVCFSLSFLFTEVSEEECLFVDALVQSAAVEDASEAIFVRNWKCESTVSYRTEILAEVLETLQDLFSVLGLFL